jgi:hypothetical protein
VHEGLGQVAAQLPLVHVVFLGVDPGRPAGGAIALEPAPGARLVPEGVGGQGHPQPAQHEGPLSLVQRPRVLAEPVHEAVVAQLVHDGVDGRPHPRVIRPGRAADDRQEQGGVDPLIAGGALPPPGGMHAVLEAGHDLVGQATPVPGLAPGVLARGPAGDGGHGPQSGHAGQAGVSPALVVQLPHARVRLIPALLDGGRGDLRGPPVLGSGPVQAGGGGQQLEDLAQRVELKLVPDAVARPGGAAGVAAHPQVALAGDGAAGHGVGRPQVRAVGQDPLGDERHRAVQQRMRPVRGHGQARVALVADPGVAVVVVADALQALGQRGRRGGHHGPAAGRQPGQHRVGVPGVADRDQAGAVGGRAGPAVLRRRPGGVRVGRCPVQDPVAQLQHQVVVVAGGHGQRQLQALPVPAGPRPPGPGEPEPDAAAAAGPDALRPG